MKTFVFSAFLLLISQLIQSQYITNYIPPSPDAAGFQKFGKFPVSKYTGVPAIRIPIHEIALEGLRIPIALKYHAGGVRVEERASVFGLGWSLDGMGVISRTLRGLPDEMYGAGYSAQNSGLNNGYGASFVERYLNNLMTAQEKFDFFTQVDNGYIDTEPDMYYLNLFNRSATIIFDGNGHPMIITDDKLKISGNVNDGFTIIDENGFTYNFSDIETTLVMPHSLSSTTGISGAEVTGNLGEDYTYNSSWYLSNIVTPNGEEVIFEYNTVELEIKYPAIVESDKWNGGDYNFCEPSNSTVSWNVTTTSTKNINNILFKGNTISFTYSYPRSGLFNDKCVDEILVKNATSTVNRIKLLYDDNMSIDFKPVLGKVLEYDCSNGSNTALPPYIFSYYGSVLPPVDSYSQDLWGYFNGKVNSTLLPKDPIIFPNGADRNIDFNFSIMGSLKSIKYPTGGVTEFIYEPHDYSFISSAQIDTVPVFEDASPSLIVNPTQGLSEFIDSDVFEIVDVDPYDNIDGQAISILMQGSGPWTGLVKVGIRGVSTGGWAIALEAYNLDYHNPAFILQPGFYKLSVFEDEPDFSAAISITYRKKTGQYHTKLPMAGQRIKEIINYSTDGQVATRKNFSYLIENSNNVSSGTIMRPRPDFIFTKFKRTWYPNQQTLDQPNMLCQYIVRQSISLQSAAITQGSLVGYREVSEYENGNMNNGKLIQRFTSFYEYPDIVYLQFPFIPNYSYDYKRGYLREEVNYKKNAAGELKRVSDIRKYYGSHINTQASPIWAVAIKKLVGGTSIALDPIGIITYSYRPEVMQLDKEVRRDYNGSDENNYVESAKEYTYDQMHSVSSEISENSKKERLMTEYKYSYNFPGEPVYDQMNNRNIFTPIIEQSISKLNGVTKYFLNSKKTNYGFWDGVNWSTVTTNIIAPKSQLFRNFNQESYETRVNYLVYDSKGYLLSASKERDLVESYIWGHNNQYPIAKSTNASSSEIYCSSFEEGGWDADMSYDNSKAHTGRYAGRIDKASAGERMSFSNQWLTISLTAPTKFRYSGWVYSNGPGAEIFLYMKRAGEMGYFSYVDSRLTTETNKWVYIEGEYTVPADVTQLNIRLDNNGGGTVWFDDIRLHPSAAQMTTYTYDPLIGMTSQSDVDNRVTYYSYDGFGRLSLILDQDKNILKRFCYNYAGQTTDCNLTLYYNDQQQATFTSTATCAAGTVPATYTHTIAANTYTSYVDKATANQLAITALNTNGQAIANTMPCQVSIYGLNSTTMPYNVVFTNTATGASTYYSTYPGSSPILLGNIAVGNYNIGMTPFGTYSATLIFNGTTYAAANSFNLNNISINSSTSFTLQTSAPSGPCSFSMASGFSSPTNSISNSGGTVSFYIVFYSSSDMYPGYNKLVATINGGCRPFTTKNLTVVAGGRTWYVTINPNGEMYWQLDYASPPLNANTTVGTSTLTYNQ